MVVDFVVVLVVVLVVVVVKVSKNCQLQQLAIELQCLGHSSVVRTRKIDLGTWTFHQTLLPVSEKVVLKEDGDFEGLKE